MAAQYGINPAVAVAQINQESGFDPRAISPAGAMGLAQFMPGTWATYGSGDPYDGENSLQAWAQYMTKLLKQFGGRYDLALAGYNSGENRKEYAAAARDGRAINWAVMPAGVQSETQNYVNKIMAQAGRGVSFSPGIESLGADSESDLTWWSAGAGGLVALLFLRRD